VADRSLAHARSVLEDKLRPELEAAATAASLSGTFGLCFGEWQERPLAELARRRKLIADLVEFARGADGQLRETDDVDPYDEMDGLAVVKDPVVVDGVDKVLFDPGDGGVEVGIIRNGWGRGVNEIQACIAKKDEKAGEYRANLAAPDTQLWLLLVAGTTYADGVLAPPSHFTFETKFDRVFFLDHWPVRSGGSTDKVVELRLRPRS
jgi:hypothetical protein